MCNLLDGYFIWQFPRSLENAPRPVPNVFVWRSDIFSKANWLESSDLQTVWFQRKEHYEWCFPSRFLSLKVMFDLFRQYRAYLAYIQVICLLRMYLCCSCCSSDISNPALVTFCLLLLIRVRSCDSKFLLMLQSIKKLNLRNLTYPWLVRRLTFLSSDLGSFVRPNIRSTIPGNVVPPYSLFLSTCDCHLLYLFLYIVRCKICPRLSVMYIISLFIECVAYLLPKSLFFLLCGCLRVEDGVGSLRLSAGAGTSVFEENPD